MDIFPINFIISIDKNRLILRENLYLCNRDISIKIMHCRRSIKNEVKMNPPQPVLRVRRMTSRKVS